MPVKRFVAAKGGAGGHRAIWRKLAMMKKKLGLTRRESLRNAIGAGVFFPLLHGAEHSSRVRFIDVAAAAGIGFHHTNAASPEKYLIETMGAGCGWIDYDNDGLMDLYLVNGAATPIYTPKIGRASC